MIRAGHPLPVLIEGSSISGLSDAGEGAIGGGASIGIGEEQWLSEQVRLPETWTILLYTDGIIEGRIGPGPERLGEAGLHGLIAEQIALQPHWREQPSALLDALIAGAERLNGEALSDDVAMLLVGVNEDQAHSDE